MASGPITSWQIDGETKETVRNFIFWSSQITADGDYSHEIKRCLLLGRKAMNNLNSLLKSRDITLPTKVHLVKAMVFPVIIIWELNYKESWALKNWCFWAVVLEKTRESVALPGDPTSPSWRKSTLNIHWKDCWSWNSNLLATRCEEPTCWKRPWCWERLRAGGEGDNREWDGWMPSPTQWTWVWSNSGRLWRAGKPAVHEVTQSCTWLSNWTATRRQPHPQTQALEASVSCSVSAPLPKLDCLWAAPRLASSSSSRPGCVSLRVNNKHLPHPHLNLVKVCFFLTHHSTWPFLVGGWPSTGSCRTLGSWSSIHRGSRDISAHVTREQL